MIISTKTYADALFQVAMQHDCSLDYYDVLLDFDRMLNDDQLQSIMCATYLDEHALEPVWKALKTVFPAEVVNFLALIQEANLMYDYHRIVVEYRDFLEEHGVLNVVRVASPRALDDTQIEELKVLLESSYPGKSEITYTTDASLIEGLVVRVNNDIYDTSLKGKLDRILNQGGLENE